MKNKISPAAIGMFVIAASIIAVAAVMVFGAAKFFARTQTFISFFSETVNGLDVGAPLKYKGVKIGKVEGRILKKAPFRSSIQSTSTSSGAKPAKNSKTSMSGLTSKSPRACARALTTRVL